MKNVQNTQEIVFRTFIIFYYIFISSFLFLHFLLVYNPLAKLRN